MESLWEKLRWLLRTKAVQHGDFVLSSGKRSTYYIDCRLVTLSPAGAFLAGRVLLERLGTPLPDAVAGMSIGADPLVTAVALTSYEDATPVAGLIVRETPKAHGAGKYVEGPLQPGMRVAIVEDTVTTGASALQAARAVTAAGGIVTGIWGLVDRMEGGAEAIQAAGYPYHAVYTLADLGVVPSET